MSLVLPPAHLPAALKDTTQSARASGALLPVRTHGTVMVEGGIRYYVRCLQPQERDHPGFAPPTPDFNPFLPHDPALFVADISPTHLALLNKFSVVDHHMLVVTRGFVTQDAPLALEDLGALRACMDQVSGVGFYNSGPLAGASQRHRHLQLVPLPVSPEGPPVPIDAAIEANPDTHSVTTITTLPFAHRLMRWTAGLPPAEDLASTYGELRAALGLTPEDAANLLLTDRWMMVVPRCAESWESVSINALGFAGALLVRSPQELERVRAAGPAALLRSVTQPGERHEGPAC
jgi:sulfate adenylyltransferase (ADP) / ATP adenylyltransferase